MSPESADPNERFRERRRHARKRRRIRRSTALAILLLAGAAIALGATMISTGGKSSAGNRNREAKQKQAKATGPRALPSEVRGVHVTMALASIPGKLDEYLAIPGLNTVELDVKDENGDVGFLLPAGSLARRTGASKPYYRADRVAAKARKAGVYLIGRLVVFEDPVLSTQRPRLAIQLRDGSVWRNNAGLGWANPYSRSVWEYNISVAEAAARAGFDEIQFDYVRFPSDGPIESAVFPGKVNEKQGLTIARFVHAASKRLRPLGVRVSVDVFGLSATHNLGIGQVPRRISRYVDAVYPMVYPSHYRPGEYNLPDPSAVPGRTVAYSLRDFRRALRGRKAKLIPWLEDFSLGRTRTAADVRAQIAAARRYHTKGFLLWNPSGVYTQEVLSGT